MTLYAIGIGSNRRHGRHGAPMRIMSAATDTLSRQGMVVRARAPIFQTAPVGLAGRRFANSAIVIESDLSPPILLAELKRIERAFGRRRGRRWDARVLDLDVLLWSGGRWRSPGVAIPHPGLTRRRFVLDPLAAIAPGWRIPGAGSVAQARVRLTRPRPVHRSGPRSGP